MRILFVIHTRKDLLTAVYLNTMERAAFLREHGHEADILTPDDFARLKRWPGRLLPLLYPLAVAYALARQGRKYDLVNFHSYSGWVFNLLRRLIPSERRTRTMTMFHGLEPLYYKQLKNEMQRLGHPLSLRYRILHGGMMLWLIKLSCRRSDLVACLNLTEVSYLLKHHWTEATKIAVTPNAVSNDFFIQREWRPDAHRLLFIGQWLDGKGIKCLVDAFTRLALQQPDLELWCVGTLGSEESVLSSFPEEVRGRIRVRPRINRAEIVEMLKNADIFVFPSLFEGFSLALLEAMSTALPVVATPVGSVPDILRAEENALIVPKNDAEALAEAVKRLLHDAPLRRKLGHHAQEKADEYKIEHVYQHYLALLERVVAGTSAKEYRKAMIELS